MAKTAGKQPPNCSGRYRGEAWILFNQDGTPDFMASAEMRSWYRKELNQGGYLLKCHIFEAEEE